MDPEDIQFGKDLGLPLDFLHLPRGTNFKIRVARSGSAGKAVVAGDLVVFQVWDTDNNRMQNFTYLGAGLGVGTPSSAEVTTGPWNDFTTSKPVLVEGFAGPARWKSIGAGPVGKGELQIPFVGGDKWGVFIPVNTGFTVGAGVSATVGVMALDGKAEPLTRDQMTDDPM